MQQKIQPMAGFFVAVICEDQLASLMRRLMMSALVMPSASALKFGHDAVTQAPGSATWPSCPRCLGVVACRLQQARGPWRRGSGIARRGDQRPR